MPASDERPEPPPGAILSRIVIPPARALTPPAPSRDARRAKPAGAAAADLARLEQRIGYRFRSQPLLERALTHASAARESGQGVVESERLEFLGDAILGFLVGEMIYRRVPSLREGPMSRLRAALVQQATLAERACALGLPEAMRLGKGEEQSGGRDKASIQSDIYEAVLAAIYLDGGLEPVRALIDREFGPLLEREIGRGAEGPIQAPLGRDPKTSLQEWLQSHQRPLPVYSAIDVAGPAHARRFTVEVAVGDETLGRGEATSKKRAEARAALAALRQLRSRSGGRRGAVPGAGGGRSSSGRAARGEKASSAGRRGHAR